MSLLRVPFLMLSAVGTWLALTPPNPPPAKGECQTSKGMERSFGKLVRIHAFAWKSSVLTSIFIETVFILVHAGYLPPTLHPHLHALLTPRPHQPPAYPLTPLFLLGTTTSLVSGLLRLACYRALGPLFTFEITLRADHKLVTTGPYAHLRHPSYAGVLLGVVGTLLVHFGPGAWFSAAGWMGTRAGWWYAVCWACMEVYVVASLMRRVPQEDALLRRRFGREWDAWAARVPYGVVPGVY